MSLDANRRFLDEATENSLDISRAFLPDGARLVIVLGFWAAVGLVFPPTGQAFATNAGIVMALLYAGLRGVALAEHTEAAYRELTPEGVLRENATALLAAGPWLLVAWLITSLWTPGDQLIDQVVSLFAYAFGWTGVALVVLFAVGTGLAALREDGAVER